MPTRPELIACGMAGGTTLLRGTPFVAAAARRARRRLARVCVAADPGSRCVLVCQDALAGTVRDLARLRVARGSTRMEVL